MPLEPIDPADPALFADDTVAHSIERLRRDDPVHRAYSPLAGEIWSVTRYQDIMAVDTNHAVFSSERSQGGASLVERPAVGVVPRFISMHPPRLDDQRKVVSPFVAPANLNNLQSLTRERTAKVDTQLVGKLIRQGDQVVMWYLSGNRGETAMEHADQFTIDRARPACISRSASASTAA